MKSDKILKKEKKLKTARIKDVKELVKMMIKNKIMRDRLFSPPPKKWEWVVKSISDIKNI